MVLTHGRRWCTRSESFAPAPAAEMVQDADSMKEVLTVDDQRSNDVADSMLFKLKSDPRMTRVGRLLRRTSLDELPQLLNVLWGEMSLVGPRPYVAEEVALMGPEALRRLAVTPGMTGLWQVSGRSDLSWDGSVALDACYADNWSVAGDLKIMAMTVPAVLGARGAC